MIEQVRLERVVLDSSVLLGSRRAQVIAAAGLGFYSGYWSSWIVAEFARKRTEWAAQRAVRDGCDVVEMRRRLKQSRERVNALIRELSMILRTVDYVRSSSADISWLKDPDDWPVMQTALAAEADTLVTDNFEDFPPGESRNHVLLIGSNAFLHALYAEFPQAEAAVSEYLQRH